MRYLLVFVCCCMLSSAGAQIHQPHQRFIEVAGGFTDKVSFNKSANSGYWLKASLGKYGKKEGIYQISLIAQGKYYQPSEALIAVHQYLVEGTFTPKAFASTNRMFYLSPVIGILIGYEGIHSGAIYAPDSASVNVNKVIVGFTGGIHGEWNMSSRTALILFCKANYLPSSVLEPFYFQYGIAIRYNYFKY